MMLACPACRAEFTLDVLLESESARDAVTAALLLPPPLGKLLLKYLALFRTGKRQLTWERTATLLAELALPIAEGKITRDGRDWPATLDFWRFGLETVIAARDADKLTLPLKSHGYLLAVIVGFSNRDEAKKEAAREQDRAYPYSKTRNAIAAGAAVGAQLGEALQKVARHQMPDDARVALEKLGHIKPRKDDKP